METTTAESIDTRAVDDFQPADHVVETLGRQLDIPHRRVLELVDEAVGLNSLDEMLANDDVEISFTIQGLNVRVMDGGDFVVTDCC